MTQREVLIAQADILEEVAQWSEQPDKPTGSHGLITAEDLRLRAVALRVQADVLFPGPS